MHLEPAIKKLRDFFQSYKRLPSYQEMCKLFGFASKKASFDLAKKLIAAGIIEKDDTGRLIPKRFFPPLPILGLIKAGYPDTADHQLLESMSFDQYLIARPERSYLLKVSGDSMIQAGINHGDLVVLEKGKEPKEGDIVVAYIDNEWTLKYYERRGGKVCLVPANPNYPILYPENSLTIEGVVVSVIRKYH